MAHRIDNITKYILDYSESLVTRWSTAILMRAPGKKIFEIICCTQPGNVL